MSRVARMPVAVPKGVDVNLGTDSVSIKGPLGTLNQAINPLVRISREGEELKVRRCRRVSSCCRD